MPLLPVHPRALAALFDHQRIGALDDPTANRPTVGHKLGRLELGLSGRKVGQLSLHRRVGGKRGEVLRRMRQIADAYGRWIVIVNKRLAPIRPIHHRAHPPGPLKPPPLKFRQRTFGKGGAVGQPREGGQVGRGDDRAIRSGHGRLHGSDRAGAHRFPRSTDEGHHGAIDAEDQGSWSRRRGRMRAQDGGRRSGLVGDPDRAGRCGLAAGRIRMDGGTRMPGQFGAGFGKGRLGRTQAHQCFVAPQRRLPGRRPNSASKGKKPSGADPM